jgi:hypothetical protein
MRTTLLLVPSLFAGLLPAQDFLHYKFDSPCLTEVINYATGAQRFPSNGTLETAGTASAWTTGMWGGALAGAGTSGTVYNRVRSGWNPQTLPFTGDLTMAWFMRQQVAPGTALSYMMGAPSGGFRLFTNGVAGTGLVWREIVLSGGNNTVRDLQLPAASANVQALAAAGWTHVAVVVDTASSTAVWYVNGNPVFTLAGVGPANIVLNGPFTVGFYSSASPYSIDEFLLSHRAYTPGEILALSLQPRAGDGPYSSGVVTQCGNAGITSVGGRPFLGNATYEIDVSATYVSLVFLYIGFDRCLFGGALPMPFDAGPFLPIASGCQILTNFDLTFNGVAAGTPAQILLSVPGDATLAGITAYAQAAAADVNGGVEASRGWSIGLGY